MTGTPRRLITSLWDTRLQFPQQEKKWRRGGSRNARRYHSPSATFSFFLFFFSFSFFPTSKTVWRMADTLCTMPRGMHNHFRNTHRRTHDNELRHNTAYRVQSNYPYSAPPQAERGSWRFYSFSSSLFFLYSLSYLFVLFSLHLLFVLYYFSCTLISWERYASRVQHLSP